MTDYTKHIDVLIDLRTYHSAPTREHQETLTAMIELLRAAARAEGDVQGYTRACLTRVVEVEAELAACKGEVERLSQTVASWERDYDRTNALKWGGP